MPIFSELFGICINLFRKLSNLSFFRVCGVLNIMFVYDNKTALSRDQVSS